MHLGWETRLAHQFGEDVEMREARSRGERQLTVILFPPYGVSRAVGEQFWARAQRRLEDNKRFAARNGKDPSLLQGICACASCSYAYYRTSTRTTNKTLPDALGSCAPSDGTGYCHSRIHTDLIWVYRLRTSWPISRPHPDCL